MPLIYFLQSLLLNSLKTTQAFGTNIKGEYLPGIYKQEALHIIESPALITV